jgi:transcriptional regulator with XRE-family HTH domain
MTHPSVKGEWVTRMADLEANAIVSAGGLAAKAAALERQERSRELMALGKLIELRRREKGLTVEELTQRTHVTEAALLDLERGIRMPNTRDVIALVARALDLPEAKLRAIAGLNGVPDPTLSSAALRFAAQARPIEPLSPSEQSALGQFLKVLTLA